MNIAVVTTFPNHSWQVYAKKMLESYVKYWPAEVPLMVQLDDDLLYAEVDKILRPQDGIAVGWDKEHKDFVERNKDKEDKDNYRHQPVRFCHKVFALNRALDASIKSRNTGGEFARYIIWLDADVHTIGPVTMSDIQQCLPREGNAVAYLGRKDWPHSECGWLAFDVTNRGDEFLEVWKAQYTSDNILKMVEQHDSWAFDVIRESKDSPSCTNLTEGQPGMDIWQHSPMSAWSVHYKGPAAKQKLAGGHREHNGIKQNIIINTQNALPNEELQAHIAANQELIKDWVQECELNDEQIVVVSAGPQLIAEDVREDIAAGKKVVAVKHALEPLKKAGITPWACILLDPRPHMLNFVEKADNRVIWFVASQVNPDVTRKLLAQGCKVYGYHASVGADEGHLTAKQSGAIIHGGSATATRGLFMLYHLGFHKFKLYGYDLSFPNKPDFSAIDDRGQPKYLEITVGMENSLFNIKKCFWTEPQLIAQFEEMNDIVKNEKFHLEAIGDGIVPFLVKMQKVSKLRQSDLKGKIAKLSSYRKLIKWNQTKPKGQPITTRFLTRLRKAF